MFSEPQVKALSSKLSAKYVRTRQYGGLTLSYIEGWHAIAEANRIFGYDAWDRQTMTIKCVWEGGPRRRNRRSDSLPLWHASPRHRRGSCCQIGVF